VTKSQQRPRRAGAPKEQGGRTVRLTEEAYSELVNRQAEIFNRTQVRHTLTQLISIALVGSGGIRK
jgi:hypothetical protein